ncbi:MAG: hypothetical protein FWG50_04470, partial [Kiritimatiellaeota bacterium]|nr:hypothetical protein [Kiritimatiellota bacterium]
MRKNVYRLFAGSARFAGSAGLPPCNAGSAGLPPCIYHLAGQKPCAPGKCAPGRAPGVAALAAALLPLLALPLAAQGQQQGNAAAEAVFFGYAAGGIHSPEHLEEAAAELALLDYQKAVWLAALYHWHVLPGSVWRDAVFAPPGAWRGGAAPLRGGVELSEENPVMITAIRPWVGGFLLDVAWLAAYLDGTGRAFDIFASAKLTRPGPGWKLVGTVRPPHTGAHDYTNCTITVTFADLACLPGWDGSKAFFSVASQRSSSGDGISDAKKRIWGIPVEAYIPPDEDWNDDGVLNGDAAMLGISPFDPDHDLDGAVNGDDDNLFLPYAGGDPDRLFKIINKLPLTCDLTLDSDNDGWPDWMEIHLFGTDPNDGNDFPQPHADGSYDWHMVTVTLGTAVAHPGAVLRFGDGPSARRVLLREAGSWDVWLPRDGSGTITVTPGWALGGLDLTITSDDPCVLIQQSPPTRGGGGPPEGPPFFWEAEYWIPGLWGLAGVPRVTIPQGHVCFHSPDAHPAEAEVTPAFEGEFVWAYGDLRVTNNPALLPRSAGWETNWPSTATVAFTPGGWPAAVSNSCPVWYCARPGPSTNAPPETGATEGYCARCGVWWTGCHTCPHAHEPPPEPGGGAGGAEPFATFVERGALPRYREFRWGEIAFPPHGGPGGGACCPCPAHAAHHSTPAVMTSCDSRLAPRRRDASGAYHALAAGAPVGAGEMIYVLAAPGAPASAAPWDAHLVVEWTQGGGTEAQTNAFTLIGGNLIADMNLTGAHGGTGNVFRSLCQLPGGWLVPIVPDTGRLLTLDPFVNMPGDFT